MLDYLRDDYIEPIETEESKVERELQAKLEPTDNQKIAIRLNLLPLYISIFAEWRCLQETSPGQMDFFYRNLLGQKVEIWSDMPLPSYDEFVMAMFAQYSVNAQAAAMYSYGVGVTGNWIQPVFKSSTDDDV